MILVIDNYDSFTYNLVQYLGEFGVRQNVVRNDEVSVSEVGRLRPSAIVISPGPCTPSQAGISVDVVRTFHNEIPILGVCLGHQAIGQAFGGRIVRAPVVVHGKTSQIHHLRQEIFLDIPTPFRATRYHSLVVERHTMPDSLEVTAWTDDGLVMGLKHRESRTFGVQFHPESIATEHGKTVLRNFLKLAGLGQ